jgi:hypothetical protein
MSVPVFISYSRNGSAADASALTAKLGVLAFFDTIAIDDGERFPQRLIDGILNARIVVIFATSAYAQSRFCLLEKRLSLAGGDIGGSHLVLALGEGYNTVLDRMPSGIANQSWPPADATERLLALIHTRLNRRLPSIRDRFNTDEAQRLSTAFVEESSLPAPQQFHGVVCSLPPGVAEQSIGSRFVGRADALRNIHDVLSGGSGSSARLTSRITAGGGFGKTRLASEYVHRYGARYYPGGVFWVNANSGSLDGEFHRVLTALDANVPDLPEMRSLGRDIRRELERALRMVGQPVLYVIDNIPEAGLLETGLAADPSPISDFCPAIGAVTILATSRQKTREDNVLEIEIDVIGRDSAILLLTDDLLGAAALGWSDWGRIAESVGDLPIALTLLDRSLALGSIAPRDLLERMIHADDASSATAELDRLRDALRGQVPSNAVAGITEAFLISFEKLDAAAQGMAVLLAQFAPAPVPEALVDAFPAEWKAPSIRAALVSRHFVTRSGGLCFGTMHPADSRFLAPSERRRGICTACRGGVLALATHDNWR